MDHADKKTEIELLKKRKEIAQSSDENWTEPSQIDSSDSCGQS